MRPLRPSLRPLRPDLKLLRPDLRPLRHGVRPLRPGVRPLRGGDGRTDGRTYVRTDIPLCHRTSVPSGPLRGRCPKSKRHILSYRVILSKSKSVDFSLIYVVLSEASREEQANE